MKQKNYQKSLDILILVLMLLLTYGVQAWRMGYYYDDWYVLWSGAARGWMSLIGLFSTDRPYMGYLYALVYRLLGDAALNWQLFALLMRLAGAVAFYWIVRLLLPGKRSLPLVMSVLFLVYPGFLALPNASTKQNHLISFASALFSLATMLQGMRHPKKWGRMLYLSLSVLLTANYLWLYEYMIGFEVVRLLLLGLELYQRQVIKLRDMLREGFGTWYPYPLVALVFLLWRLLIFNSTRGTTNSVALAQKYLSHPIEMIFRLFSQTVTDFLTANIFAWFVQPYFLLSRSDFGWFVMALLAGLAGAILLFFYFRQNNLDVALDAPDWMITFGALVTLAAVFPVVLSDRFIDLMNPYKGYGLHPIPGVVMLVTGLIWKLKPGVRQWVFLSLVTLSVATHVLNANWWGGFWETQKSLWWQMSWRAPDLAENTLLMVALPKDTSLQQDYEAWSPANLIFRPGAAEMPSIQSEVLNRETALDILTRNNLWHKTRDIPVRLNFKNLLLVSQPTVDSCVQVMDGAKLLYSAQERAEVMQVAQYSHLDQIQTVGKSKTPPGSIFGAEPAHGWCYYFQKASLADQRQDWPEIGKLYDEAQIRGLKPADLVEMYPFLEGLLHLGRQEDAVQLYQLAAGDEGAEYALCAAVRGPTVSSEAVQNEMQTLLCSKPK